MDAADLVPLLEQLEDNVDDLEEVLKPLFGRSLTEASNKLPVLDKAKLHVLITYALESLLFSYLRLHGVNAKEHPVFRELTRVKQYFEKIKALETVPEKPTLVLDKQAAGRFIKHGLAGNDKIDLERAEREAKEKAVAQLKASMLAKKSESAPISSARTENKSEVNSDSGSGASDSEDGEATDVESTPVTDSNEATASKKSEKKAAKASKKLRKLNKQEQREAKKERRQKKEKLRKAKKAK